MTNHGRKLSISRGVDSAPFSLNYTRLFLLARSNSLSLPSRARVCVHGRCLLNKLTAQGGEAKEGTGVVLFHELPRQRFERTTDPLSSRRFLCTSSRNGLLNGKGVGGGVGGERTRCNGTETRTRGPWNWNENYTVDLIKAGDHTGDPRVISFAASKSLMTAVNVSFSDFSPPPSGVSCSVGRGGQREEVASSIPATSHGDPFFSSVNSRPFRSHLSFHLSLFDYT